MLGIVECAIDHIRQVEGHLTAVKTVQVTFIRIGKYSEFRERKHLHFYNVKPKDWEDISRKIYDINGYYHYYISILIKFHDGSWSKSYGINPIEFKRRLPVGMCERCEYFNPYYHKSCKNGRSCIRLI